MSKPRRIIILAEGKFSPLKSKTANQAIRYIPNEIVGVIDKSQAGSTAQNILGFGGDIQVFADVQTALQKKPDTLLIGIAPTGGRLPDEWRGFIIEAIESGLNIISGLHTYISDDREFVQKAIQFNVKLTDLRKVPAEYKVIAQGLWKKRKVKTILTVGTDCNVGKMTASLELHREFIRRGLKSDFLATGQTGILLSGKGIAVDALVSDFVAGAIEKAIEELVDENIDYIHVEGQGSLTHQGYSGVTLSLIHGVMPDAMIMVHHPNRMVDDYGFSLENVPGFIDLHERIIAPFKKSKVVGIAINTIGMTQPEIHEAIFKLEKQTNLPVADVLTPEVSKLADALIEYFARYK